MEREAVKALLRHPRLAALELFGSASAGALSLAWFDAALDAVGAALGPDGQREGCSLEKLRVSDNRDRDDAVFPDAASVAQAFGSAGQALDAAPLLLCSLRCLRVGYYARPDFVRGVLAASRGSLRHLIMSDNVDETSVCRLVRDSVHGPAVFKALLGHIGASLETLVLGSDLTEASLLPSMTPLLISDGCRLRTFGISAVDFDAAAAGGGRPFRHVCQALAANSSLRTVLLKGAEFSPREVLLVGAMLSARTAPLDFLDLSKSSVRFSLGGALGVDSGVRRFIAFVPLHACMCRNERRAMPHKAADQPIPQPQPLTSVSLHVPVHNSSPCRRLCRIFHSSQARWWLFSLARRAQPPASRIVDSQAQSWRGCPRLCPQAPRCAHWTFPGTVILQRMKAALPCCGRWRPTPSWRPFCGGAGGSRLPAHARHARHTLTEGAHSGAHSGLCCVTELCGLVFSPCRLIRDRLRSSEEQRSLRRSAIDDFENQPCSAEHLCPVILRNTSLTTLDLSGLCFPASDYVPVAAAVARNRTLRFLSIGGSIRGGGSFRRADLPALQQPSADTVPKERARRKSAGWDVENALRRQQHESWSRRDQVPYWRCGPYLSPGRKLFGTAAGCSF